MVMAIFFEVEPFQVSYNGGEVKVILGREGREDYVELPHVRVALQFPVYLYVYVHSFPHFPTSAVLKSAAMVMAIFLKWSPFRYNGGKVKVVLGRGECEDYVELPCVRMALQFHIFVCVCVFTYPPPSPLLQSSNLR